MNFKHKVNKAEVKPSEVSSSDDETIGRYACHALSVSSTKPTGNWIVDSGATCHMCADKTQFITLEELKKPLKVTLGDGFALQATGRGTVFLNIKFAEKKFNKCKLRDVLYVPDLSCNLLSVSQVTTSGKVVKFTDADSQILDENEKLVAKASRVGALYYLNCQSSHQQTCAAKAEDQNTKENLWHRRYGHLGTKGLQQLAREKLVDGFDYDPQSKVDFCESCVDGKHHQSQFPAGGGKRSNEVLGLVHSDVCGKMNSQSLSGAEYFLTFIDDKT